MNIHDSPIISVMSDDIIADEKDKRCAPSLTFEDRSCMSLSLLIQMAKAYNKEFPDTPIKLHSNIEALETLNPTKYKRYLLSKFSERLDDICDNQRCWIKQDFIKKINKELLHELSNNTFRPPGPAGKFTWLNTININDVLSQYESKHPEFKSFGAVPVDFDSLSHYDISNVDLNKIVNVDKKTQIGVVFNLDEHNQPGSHWVGSFADFTKGQVYYFDSYGIGPEERIRKFLRKCANFCTSCNIKNTDVRFNKHRHQRQGSECGVYSLNFIIRMLEGETFDEITTKITPDLKVNKCRQEYFT